MHSTYRTAVVHVETSIDRLSAIRPLHHASVFLSTPGATGGCFLYGKASASTKREATRYAVLAARRAIRNATLLQGLAG